MPSGKVKPNGWAVIRLPNDDLKVLEVTPNTYVLPLPPA